MTKPTVSGNKCSNGLTSKTWYKLYSGCKAGQIMCLGKKERQLILGREAHKKKKKRAAYNIYECGKEATQWGQRERNPTVRQDNRRRGHLRMGIP